jgi:hypothetical protein
MGNELELGGKCDRDAEKRSYKTLPRIQPVDHGRKSYLLPSWNITPRTTKNAASRREAAFLLFTTSKEEFYLSLAGLAVTYSPRA